MSEMTFRSPGFFDKESDQSQPNEVGPEGVPAGVIGTSDKGPAFVPITVASFSQFTKVFGNLNPKKFGPYAAFEFLKHRKSLTFLRVLGAGATELTSDISKVELTGQAKNAGFVVTGSTAANDTGRHMGAVQFLVARHTLQSNEAFGMPMFTQNDSFTGSSANLVRGMVLLASGARMMILDGNQSAVGAFGAGLPDDFANVNSGLVKLVISSSNGVSFGVADGNRGVKIFSASFNPTSANYFGKLLNTDPDQFAAQQHLLYADFAVDDEIATAVSASIVSGSSVVSRTSGDTTMAFRDVFGHFDSRFSAPKTPKFISQPFGNTEYDLFHFEALDDGEYANKLYKISISNLKISSDQLNPYGTFTVLVRSWSDTDTNQVVLEQFPNCSLDPNAENYVASVIGDRKVYFNFNAEQESERRLVVDGKYNNKSAYVRVVMDQSVERQQVPASTLPFGFRGLEVLKTNDALADTSATTYRFGGVGTSVASGSILPPIPFRFKVTKGAISTSGFVGSPGTAEIVNGNYFWGVKFDRNNVSALNTNVNSEKNDYIESLTKFIGIRKLDALVTGSGADSFNNNKFTLARVAFGNTAITDLTGTVEAHMKDAAYIRNGRPDASNYTINDGTLSGRLTFGTLAAQTSSVHFNRFSTFAKFTTFLAGGFDGLNILDNAARRMNDKSVSFDSGGAAESSYVSPGLAQNQSGIGTANNAVFSYKTAADIMTNGMNVNPNILLMPGIKEPYLTDYTSKKVKDYGLAVYLMDIPSYDDNSIRLYDDSTGRPDVSKTASTFDGRGIDNNYVTSYFPDVFVDDATNKRRVKVPSSIAALAALGYNDRVSYPWFAPAGFNRAALDFVTNVTVRLSSLDRDTLSDVRINPIATIPREGFVIFGQKTLQQAKSALDRVNVRRLMLEVKRVVIDIAMQITFNNNTTAVREKFVSEATTSLGLIQTQAGIEKFNVIMNETNNTDLDEQNNRVNGKIIIVPTRTFEVIALDFIITNSGVSFV